MNLEKYLRSTNLKFIEDIPDELLCVICKSILCNPYTIPCGHNYCLNCIIRHLENNSTKLCIGDDVECKESELNLSTNVVINFGVAKRIKMIKVNCLMKNCNEIVELGNMDYHIENCPHKLISCPYYIIGCNRNKMTQNDLKQHMYDAALNHSSIMVDHVQELRNNNNELKLEIECIRRQEQENIKTIEKKFESEMEMMKLFLTKSIFKTNFYDWIIEDYRSKFKHSKRKIDKYYRSNAFYLEGYHFVLFLYPYKDGQVKLQCQLIKGDYDDFINWPCCINLQFGIIDCDNMDYTCKYWPRNYMTTNEREGNEIWRRPIDDDCDVVPRASSQFYEICNCESPTDLKCNLLNNDSIKVRVKIL